MSGSGASTGVDREVAELGELLPQVEIKTATGSFVSASYIRTPTAAVKGTLTLPDGYPTRPLIVAVQASDVVPPGLKRKLEKDLGKVAAASAGEGHLCAGPEESGGLPLTPTGLCHVGGSSSSRSSTSLPRVARSWSCQKPRGKLRVMLQERQLLLQVLHCSRCGDYPLHHDT